MKRMKNEWMSEWMNELNYNDLAERIAPFSSYSAFDIHIDLKVANDDKIDPPIHVE